MNITFTEGVNTITSDEYLYQWDMGQVLNISGLSVISAPELHFATRKADKAYVVQSVLSGSVIQGNVPDTVLQTGANIVCYIYINNGLDKHTVKQVIIPVVPREKPNDYIEPSSEEIIEAMNIFEQLAEDLEALEAKVDSYNLDNVMQKDVYTTSGTPDGFVANASNSTKLNGHIDTYFATQTDLTEIQTEIQTDLTELLNNKTSFKLLWTNASPQSSFAGQTISIPLSEYDGYMIMYRPANGSSMNDSVIVTGMESTLLQSVMQGESTLTINYRKCIVSADGQSINLGNATNNGTCIPYKIYGIKGGIL